MDAPWGGCSSDRCGEPAHPTAHRKSAQFRADCRSRPRELPNREQARNVSVGERPEQLPALRVEPVGLADAIEVAEYVFDHERIGLELARERIERRLEAPLALRRLDDPEAKLEVLFDRDRSEEHT